MFLFPPRPENAIPPALIKGFERRGFVAQKKKNGTCQVISIFDDMVTYRTRHNEPNKAWSPPAVMDKYFVGFPNTIFIGELLHAKHPSVKNTIILFDVLQYLGTDLVGTTLAARLKILNTFKPLTKQIQIIETYTEDFLGLYQSLSDPLDEGIVLKDPAARLRDCRRDGLNSGWQVKCRKGTKNYGF